MSLFEEKVTGVLNGYIASVEGKGFMVVFQPMVGMGKSALQKACNEEPKEVYEFMLELQTKLNECIIAYESENGIKK